MSFGKSKTIFKLAFAHFNTLKSLNTDLPELLLTSGINRIAFLRHGNTLPKDILKTDFDRELSDVGKEQAKISGLSFGANALRPFSSFVICSSAPRCISTANIFLDNCEIQVKPKLKLVSKMYDGTMQPEGSRLFRKHGYAPLRTYLEDSNIDDAKIAHKILLSGYANDVLQEIAKIFCNEKNDEKQLLHSKSTLLLVGHAIYLPSIALALMIMLSKADADFNENDGIFIESKNLILDTNTKEAEGYLIDLENKFATLLCR